MHARSGLKQKPDLSDLFRSPQNFLAFGLGAGLAPVAPGTMGSLCALPVIWLMGNLDPVSYLIVCTACFLVGVWACGEAERYLSASDPSTVVWDEMVGMQITLLLVPVTWTHLLVGLVLFRLIDIFKPWPVSFVERRAPGGLGIMLDDALAGLFAALVLLLFATVSGK